MLHGVSREQVRKGDRKGEFTAETAPHTILDLFLRLALGLRDEVAEQVCFVPSFGDLKASAGFLQVCFADTLQGSVRHEY